MRISLLALDGLFDTGLAVTIDALTAANNLSAALMGGATRFDVSIVGVRKKVRSRQGLTVPVQPVSAELKPDWVIVPALNTTTPETLIPSLQRPDVLQGKAQLLKWKDTWQYQARHCPTKSGN